MDQEFANSTHFPQFDALRGCDGEPLRVVLLGASNLSIMFPTIVETARRALARPIEWHVAHGFGRSFGQESGFCGKKFSGILQTRIWDALARDSSRETIAVVADVGNDLGYETPVETLLEWVVEAVDRLLAVGARAAVNNVPLAALEGVGPARYRLLRSLLFPRCRLSRDEMLERVRSLSATLAREVEKRKTPVFSAEKSWYGFDPIHPRRRSAAEIWQRLLSAVTDSSSGVEIVRPPWRQAMRLRGLQPASARHRGPIEAVEVHFEGDPTPTKFFMY